MSETYRVRTSSHTSFAPEINYKLLVLETNSSSSTEDSANCLKIKIDKTNINNKKKLTIKLVLTSCWDWFFSAPLKREKCISKSPTVRSICLCTRSSDISRLAIGRGKFVSESWFFTKKHDFALTWSCSGLRKIFQDLSEVVSWS